MRHLFVGNLLYETTYGRNDGELKLMKPSFQMKNERMI